ncbi:MAG: MATE family efflux transporter [Anaerovorax sp.]|nr:MATE family efflux transporter [Anaerovorax sp.]
MNILAHKFGVFSLLRFAFPTIFMMIFVGLYTLIDTIFVSRFINTNALSSINIVCPVINVITGLGAMVAAGSSAIIAKKMGEGDERGARESLTFIVLFVIAAGLFLTAIGIIFIKPIIYGLGGSKLLFPYCYDYLVVLLLFIPVNLLQIIFQTLFVTAGKPRLGLWLILAAGIANTVLDYVFIVYWDMGIAGAALSDGIGYCISTITGILFFLHNKEVLYFCKPKFDLKLIVGSCSNGSSEMVGQLSTAVTTIFFNALMMQLLGEEGVAGITIIIYSQFLLSTFYIGFSMGVAPIISYNFGSQSHTQLKQIFRICIFLILFTSGLIFLFSIICGPLIVNFFTPEGTFVYRIAKEGFFIFSFNFLFCGYNIFTSALFTALSNGKISALVSFLRTFGFVTTGLLLLPRILQVTGIWLAIPLAELLTFVMSVYLIYRYRTRYHYM